MGRRDAETEAAWERYRILRLEVWRRVIAAWDEGPRLSLREL
jgi:hypothetical protein